MLWSSVRVTAPRSMSLSNAPGSASQPQMSVPPGLAAARAVRGARIAPPAPSATVERKRRRLIERFTAVPPLRSRRDHDPGHTAQTLGLFCAPSTATLDPLIQRARGDN